MRRPPVAWPSLITVLLLLFGLAGCAAAPPKAGDSGTVTVLAMNDVSRIEGVENGAAGSLARLRTLRLELEAETPDLLVLGAGDFLYPSLLSRVYDGRQIVDVLNRLDGDDAAFDQRLLVAFGNHEFDKQGLKQAGILDARVEESRFTWLGSNLAFESGDDGLPLVAAGNLPPHLLVESNGVLVGIYSTTTDFTRPAYVASFGDPVDVARRESAALRAAGAQLVIALTHQSLSVDRRVLEELGAAGPDLVIGGHEHLRNVVEVNGRYIVKSDADLRSAAVIVLKPRPGRPPQVAIEHRMIGGSDPPPDPALAAVIADWLQRHDEAYCAETFDLPPGCLDVPIGRTRVRLLAEESEIRRFETNLGDWVLDQALAALRPEGAEIAFLNAGSLRLNQDLPPGPITRRHLDELFAYANDLRLVRVSGAMLQDIVRRATTEWESAGWFLQIAGFAYRFDPATGKVGDLTLLTPQGPRPIAPDDELLAVTNDFLTDPKFGQDGYTMLTPDRLVTIERKVPSLRDVVIEALGEAGPEGIAPDIDGRICNTQRPGPCLALPAAGS